MKVTPKNWPKTPCLHSETTSCLFSIIFFLLFLLINVLFVWILCFLTQRQQSATASKHSSLLLYLEIIHDEFYSFWSQKNQNTMLEFMKNYITLFYLLFEWSLSFLSVRCDGLAFIWLSLFFLFDDVRILNFKWNINKLVWFHKIWFINYFIFFIIMWFTCASTHMLDSLCD